MALGFTSLDTGSESSSDGTVLTASESPADGSALYLTVAASFTGISGSNDPITFYGVSASVAGLSGTWTQMAAVTYAVRRVLWVFRGTKASAWGSGQFTITVDDGSATLQDVAYTLDQVTGLNTADPDDAPVTGSANNSLALGDIGTVDAGDAVFVAGGHEHGANNFQCTGYTGISSIGGLANVRQIRTWYDDSSPDETPNLTSDGAGNGIGGIAFVINVAAGGTSYTLTAEQGSYALTGQAAALRAARQLAAAQGAYALTGQTAGLQYGRKVGAAQGSYALTGQAAALRAARQLAALQGAYALSGQAAGVQYGRKVAAAQGSYALMGQDVALRTSRTILAAQGSYALNGQAAGLIYDAGDEVLTAEPGSYTLNGEAANLRAARTVLAELGTYSLSGQAARLARDARLVLEAGAYALNGQAAALTAPSKLVAEFGVYTLSGQDAVLLYEPVAGDGLADPTSRLPSEWAEPPAKRPRHWEPFDLSYFRWKYARDRARVELVELSPPAAQAFKRSVEDRADEIDEDIEELEAEIARFERANARQRRIIGDVEAAIAQVQAVLELAIGARQRQQEELAMILIIVSLLTPGGSRRR